MDHVSGKCSSVIIGDDLKYSNTGVVKAKLQIQWPELGQKKRETRVNWITHGVSMAMEWYPDISLTCGIVEVIQLKLVVATDKWFPW